MRRRIKLTLKRLDGLLAEVVANQAAEGLKLTADEILDARAVLMNEHLERRSWSVSWDFLCAIARTLNRPDLLSTGRQMELFACGVLATVQCDEPEAWSRVETELACGRRDLVKAVLEALKAGPRGVEMADPVRLQNLSRGMAAARRAGWPYRLRMALAEDLKQRRNWGI